MDISSSIVLLQPGLYVLRHPKVAGVALSVTRGPNCLSKIDMLSTPKTHGTLLRNGADCIVMLISHGPAELLVTAICEVGTLGTKPSIKIDRIGLDEEPNSITAPSSDVAAEASAIPQPNPSRAIEISPQGLTIIGHVERKGDVVAAEGEILGDPEKTQRVEGFQLMWPDRPQGLDLAYSISVEGFGATPVVKTGNFCGTRGQARRITEVTFTLIGPDAEKFRLDGQACFSGGFKVPVESGVPLGGPSGMEHLTAISLRPVAASGVVQGNPWNDEAKTKVFKAKATASKKTESKKADVRSVKSK